MVICPVVSGFVSLFRLIGEDLWQLEGDEVENEVGKTWTQRG